MTGVEVMVITWLPWLPSPGLVSSSGGGWKGAWGAGEKTMGVEGSNRCPGGKDKANTMHTTQLKSDHTHGSV